MPIRKINPIAEKIRQLIGSGKTTKEKICVAAELKYHTLQNIFTRDTISYMTLKSLKYSGVITERDEIEYQKWVDIHVPPKKRTKKPNRLGKKQVLFSPEVEEAIDSILLEDENVDDETKSDADKPEGKAE